MKKGDEASPSIILAGRALLMKMLITLEPDYAFGPNFEYFFFFLFFFNFFLFFVIFCLFFSFFFLFLYFIFLFFGFFFFFAFFFFFSQCSLTFISYWYVKR